MKFVQNPAPVVRHDESRPVWGAWIEIQTRKRQSVQKWSRAPYGARGLKSLLPKQLTLQTVVAPRMGRVD